MLGATARRGMTSSGGGFITQDQLAAALAAATASTASSATASPSSASSMFSATGASPFSFDQQQQRPQAASQGAPDSDMAAKVAQMKEMGIVDEGLAMRALTVMGGDLQAAIDLIFSGWLGEDDTAN